MRCHRIPCSFAVVFAAIFFRVGTLSADSLEDGFRNPPDSARPQTWWHWMNGNVTKEGITLDLEAMKRVGIGGAQIFNVDCDIPAGPVKLLSPEWRELMHHAVSEADRLGLELCIHNGAGWSSSGGPWNTPANAMQRVTFSERKVIGPAHFSGSLRQPPTKLDYYRDIAVFAFPSQPRVIQDIEAKGGFNGDFADFSPDGVKDAKGRAIPRSSLVDLTAQLGADGHLDWDVPAGDWTILRVGYTPTGENNHPAPREGTGLECDKFSQAALDTHWAGYVQKVFDDAGPLAGTGKAFDNVLIDSYEVGGQNWTPQFRDEFKQRRGYDPLPYLPVLTGRIVDSPEISERFLWDMRRTIADLFADNYYGHFQELCHQHGLKASFEPYTGPFDSMQCGGRADIPMGEFWAGSEPDASVKLASSIGHTYGQPIIGAESFTGAPARDHGRWLDDPYSLKALGDRVFCVGINRYIFHRYAMQPWTNRWPGMTMGPWGTHFDRTSTWWEQGRAWLQYVARCQFLLQRGRCVADAAYFCGENAPSELREGDPAMPAGYFWDQIDATVLLRHARVKDGCLTLDSGASYRLLILPPAERDMRPEILNQLRQFVADGLTVVGARPQISPSLQNYPTCDADVKQMAAELWGNCDGSRVTKHSFGKGAVFLGEPLDRVCDKIGLKPDFDHSTSDGAKLTFIHRQDGDADIYFVSNQRKQSESVDCAFRVTGKAPELWNAETGSMMPAPIWREENGRTVVSLSLDPAGSVFVAFRKKPQGDHLVAIHPDLPARPKPVAKPQELRIVHAEYGAFDAAGQVDVTGKVRSLIADGATEIRADNDLADEDPAENIVKRLRVVYQMGDQKKTAYATEGDSLNVPAGAVALEAVYGDLPGDFGPNWIDVTEKVKALAAQGDVEIRAENELAGGDPNPNATKTLIIEYRLGGNSKKEEIREGASFTPPDGAEIIKAQYGSAESRKAEAKTRRTVDVTAALSRRLADGRLTATANNSLAGGDPALLAAKELRLDYTINGRPKHAVFGENESFTLPEDGSGIEPPRSYAFSPGAAGGVRLLSWTAGKFKLTWASGHKSTWDSSAPSSVVLDGPWRLSFPHEWSATTNLTLPQLESWSDNSDPSVKYFSGTAAYYRDIELSSESLASNREVWLDLGAVENLAEVFVNGQSVGILWKPPFCVNLSPAVHPGTNVLEIKVTNLWPNRLIGDEQLASDREWGGGPLKSWPQWLLEGKPSPTARLTFTTWHHWKKDDALLPSGLLGPVTLRVAAAQDLPEN